MLKSMVFLFLCVASTFAAMEGLQECKGVKAPLPLETSNSQCESSPCTISNGATVESITTFKIPAAATSLTYNVDAYLGSFKIPFEFVPEDQKDACKALTSGSCPVKEGDEVTHKVSLPVEAPMEATIFMEAYITDQDKKAIFCYRTTVTVQGVVA